MNDHPPSQNRIDLVFEALARLAGAREAERAISRSVLRQHLDEKRHPEPSKKLSRTP